jgi:hypothetical protein
MHEAHFQSAYAGACPAPAPAPIPTPPQGAMDGPRFSLADLNGGPGGLLFRAAVGGGAPCPCRPCERAACPAATP